MLIKGNSLVPQQRCRWRISDGCQKPVIVFKITKFLSAPDKRLSSLKDTKTSSLMQHQCVNNNERRSKLTGKAPASWQKRLLWPTWQWYDHNQVVTKLDNRYLSEIFCFVRNDDKFRLSRLAVKLFFVISDNKVLCDEIKPCLTSKTIPKFWAHSPRWILNSNDLQTPSLSSLVTAAGSLPKL